MDVDPSPEDEDRMDVDEPDFDPMDVDTDHEENEVEQGHDSDEEGGRPEASYVFARPPDINRAEDPALYDAIVRMTEAFENMSLGDWQQGSPVQQQAVGGSAASSTAQLERVAGPSYQEHYTSSKFGDFKRVQYNRDAKGTFDFAARPLVYPGGQWTDPVYHASWVDLAHGSNDKRFGISGTGRKVELKSASRAVHFGIANRQRNLPYGNESPPGWTWHHLPDAYKMVLVDRQVHRKHGHNGGKYLWK